MVNAMRCPEQAERVRGPVVDVVDEVVEHESDQPRDGTARGRLPGCARRIHGRVDPEERSPMQSEYPEADRCDAEVGAELAGIVDPSVSAYRNEAFCGRCHYAQSEEYTNGKVH